MGKSRKSLTRESQRVHSGQWSQKLQALQRGGDRSRPRLGGEPGSTEAGGTLPEVQGDWPTRMRGGGALGEELTGRQSRQRDDWTVRKELDQIWLLIGLSGGGVASARGREGERARLACPRAGRATSAAGARSSSGSPVLSSGPPRSGLGSRGGKLGEAGAGSRAEGDEARCAAARSSPGAAGPGRAGLRGARTMRADCRPPRWRAGRR